MRFLLPLVFLSLPALAQIEGRWLTEDKKGVIEITKRGGKFYGKVVGGEKRGDGMDRKNPDPKEQEKPILGKEILKGLKKAGKKKYGGGRIYDPDSGNTYSAKAELDGEKLRLRGYMGLSLLGRTSVWTREKTPSTPAQKP